MSQPTSVQETITLFAHEDRKRNLSSNSSPTEDVDMHEVPRLLWCSSIALGMEGWENEWGE